MELRHLQQVVEITRAGSFSRAARRLNVSQPSLSKSIAGLEAELSIKLFDRDGGAARPTEYGLFVAERAEELLKSTAALKRDIARLAGGETGRLRIGVGAVARLKPLPEVVKHLGVQFPHLLIEVRQEPVPAMIRSLISGRYDVLFCNAQSAQMHGDLIRVKIFEDRDVIAVGSSHPLIKEAPVPPARLLDYPIASFPLPPHVIQWFGSLSGQAEKNLGALVSDDHDLIKHRAIETDFVAMAPSFVFAQEFRDGTLVELPTINPPGYECWMLTTRTRWESPVIKAIAEMAKSVSMGRVVAAQSRLRKGQRKLVARTAEAR